MTEYIPYDMDRVDICVDGVPPQGGRVILEHVFQ